MFKPHGYPKTSVSDSVAAQQNQAMSAWFADAFAAQALRRSPVRAPMYTVKRNGKNNFAFAPHNA